MANVGPLELGIVLIIVLLVFGPKRLPEVAQSLGRGVREFKSSVSGEHDRADPTEAPPPIESSEPASSLEADGSAQEATARSHTPAQSSG